MKCHLCQSELIPESYANWHVGNRKSVAYHCRNKKCSQQEGKHLVILNMILPDNNAEDYTLPIILNGQWYWIYAGSRGKPYTALWSGNNLVLGLERFYPISLEDDLFTRVDYIVDKLKTLLLFI